MFTKAPEWTIYFCGYFDTTPTAMKTFRGTGTNNLTYPASSTEAVKPTSDGSTQLVRLGAVYSFSKSSVTSRVGVSFISSAQACRNVNSEITKGTSLAAVRSATKSIWNSKLLGKVTTTEVSFMGSVTFESHDLHSDRQIKPTSSCCIRWSMACYCYLRIGRARIRFGPQVNRTMMTSSPSGIYSDARLLCSRFLSQLITRSIFGL